MISFIFKSSIAFIICFIVLSFQVNNKSLFYHISELTGPIGADVQNSIERSVKRSYKKSKKISEDLFHNSDPKYFDEIQSKRSATKSSRNSKEVILEKIHRDEIRNLDRVIKKN